MRIRKECIAAWMIFGVCGWAQQGRVAGPLAGYVFDSSARLLRPVLGIPGASLMGAPMNFAYELSAVTVSPRGDTAVALAADGTSHLVALASGAASEIALNGMASRPDRVVYSPSGTSAALVGAGRAQIVTGLGSSPSLAGVVELSAGSIPANFQTAVARRPVAGGGGSLALSDDGNWVLEAAGGSVQLIGVQGGRNSLFSVARGSLVVFAPGSYDAAAFDPGSSTLVLIRDVAGAAERHVLAQTPDIAQTAGLAFSADGKSLFLAAKGGVWAFDTTTGNRAAIACDCAPTGIERMGNVYRLSQFGSAPLWLLDPTSSPMRIVFVPAASE